MWQKLFSTQVDRTFLKVHAKNLAKVAGIELIGIFRAHCWQPISEETHKDT